MRGKKRSKKQQQSVAFDTDDDSESVSELPRSTYELQRQENIANNQHRLDELDARVDMSEQPRSTDGAPKQPTKRCESKPLHVHAAVPL
jgi:hypothetical protein